MVRADEIHAKNINHGQTGNCGRPINTVLKLSSNKVSLAPHRNLCDIDTTSEYDTLRGFHLDHGILVLDTSRLESSRDLCSSRLEQTRATKIFEYA